LISFIFPLNLIQWFNIHYNLENLANLPTPALSLVSPIHLAHLVETIAIHIRCCCPAICCDICDLGRFGMWSLWSFVFGWWCLWNAVDCLE